MASAQKFYDSLSLPEKRFIDDKTMSSTLSIKNWIAFLSRASAYDAYILKARGKFVGGIVLSVGLTIASTIVYYNTSITWLVALPVLFGISAAWFVSRLMTLMNRDINDTMRLFFMPFLEIIKTLAGEDAKLSATLDFRNPLKVIKPEEGKINGRDLKVYSANYITAKVALSDTSFLETVIADDIKKLTYRNARGKYKSKTKTVHHYFIRLSVQKNIYKLKGLRLHSNMELAETTDMLIFKLKGKTKELKSGIINPQDYFLGLQNIYSMIIRHDASDEVATASAGDSGNRAEDRKGITTTPSSVIPPMIWSDRFFDTSDFDSLRYQDDLPLNINDDSKLNIFDS